MTILRKNLTFLFADKKLVVMNSTTSPPVETYAVLNNKKKVMKPLRNFMIFIKFDNPN